MTNIIQFPEKQEPTIGGEAHCIGCGHKWLAVAPVGTWELECGECHAIKGIFTNLVSRTASHFECNCGSYYFAITPDGEYCVNCGAWATR